MVPFFHRIFQARIQEIISGRNDNHRNGHDGPPWMVDGAGLSPDADKLLARMVVSLHSPFPLNFFS